MRRLLMLTALLLAFPAHAVDIEWVVVPGTGTPNACDPIGWPCGLGAELAFLLPPLTLLWLKRRRSI